MKPCKKHVFILYKPGSPCRRCGVLGTPETFKGKSRVMRIFIANDETEIALVHDADISTTPWLCFWRHPGAKEWNEFGGSVGYGCAHFKIREQAQAFITRGLAEEIKNPDIWTDMVAV